jgi:V8-like Glu-specific endopeptidase
MVGVDVTLRTPTILKEDTNEVFAPGAAAIRIQFIGGCNNIVNDKISIYTLDVDNLQVVTHTCAEFENGQLLSQSIMGDTAYVQFEGKGNLAVSSIGYITPKIYGRDPTEDGGRRLEQCSSNRACIQYAECVDPKAIPNAIQAAKTAIALILFHSSGSYYICSGGLIADQTKSGTPYFLTANHCVSTASEAAGLETFFDYKHSDCTSCPLMRSPSTVGATIRATSRKTDFTLIELSQKPLGSRAYLGWNAGEIAFTAATSLYRLSHPRGAPQAYSKHAVNTVSGTCISTRRGNFIYSNDVFGATDGGSSGSPVLNDAGEIVGQLYGACGSYNDLCNPNLARTVDGAFAVTYGYIQQFLDPAGSDGGGDTGGDGGTVGTCNEKPSGAGCISGSECCSGKCTGRPGSKTCN